MNSYAGIELIRNDILFNFVDEVDAEGKFVDTTSSIIIGIDNNPMLDESGTRTRWINVLAIGPDCDEEIQVGMKVLVNPLKWSYEFNHNKERFWKTDDKQIVAIYDE